jgi:hypothetical protein
LPIKREKEDRGLGQFRRREIRRTVTVSDVVLRGGAFM